ncbi:class I SAM-dependent methyltransferase [Rhodovastum atsumiense]|nr:class I SAM-dependent methyltransferase [Rhodovastum atsumiense]
MNSSRIWLEREMAAFAGGLPAGAVVLDAGAGDQPYRHLFAHCTYESADFEKVDKPYARSTYVCDLAHIPVEDARYDAVVFSQVMEHLPDPAAVLAELARVLRPGGRLFYSGPLFYEEHEQPYDYYRYTQFAVRLLLQRGGFTVVQLRWLEGYLGTCAYQLERMSSHLPRRPADFGGGLTGVAAAVAARAARPLCKLCAKVLYWLDARHRFTQAGYPKNWLALADKPA